MLRSILFYGAIAGIIVIVPTAIGFMFGPPPDETLADGSGMVFGYATMLVALSVIFIGVKRYRDKVLGGVIKFVPALLMGSASAWWPGLSTSSAGRSRST